MRIYTLSLDIFNQQDELIETIEFLKSQYPNLLGDRPEEYIKAVKNYHANSDESLARNRFAIIMAFNKLYNNGDDNRKVRDIYEVQGQKREELLAKIYTANSDYLDSCSVDIESGVENGLLVEVNYIIFTQDEVNYIRQYLSASPIPNSTFESILNKLK